MNYNLPLFHHVWKKIKSYEGHGKYFKETDNEVEEGRVEIEISFQSLQDFKEMINYMYNSGYKNGWDERLNYFAA